MDGVGEVIRESANSIEKLGNSGENGFVVFAILTVALVLILMGTVAYKSQKTLIQTLTGKHKENAKAILDAHDRIHEIETRENDCIRRLDSATGKLEGCTMRLEDCFNAMKKQRENT